MKKHHHHHHHHRHPCSVVCPLHRRQDPPSQKQYSMTNKEKIEQMLKFFYGQRTLKDLLMEMAEWKQEQMSRIAIEWLENELSAGDLLKKDKEGIIRLFRNAMNMRYCM